MRRYGWFGAYEYGKYLAGYNGNMDVSFCIVNLNAKKHLNGCIASIPRSLNKLSYEIIIIDNNSMDGSVEYIQDKYPSVHWIINSRNEGYTKAINQALRVSRGSYKVVLNPDSILMPDSISKLLTFISSDENIGIAGPKVIDSTGSFQKSCRRGIARPSAVFSYFLGFSRLYPSNEKYTGYHLNHLSPNETNEVGGVSGSCMVIRKDVIDTIGYFDERYFAYQEDSDYCLTASKNGWKVYYHPDAIVKHVGGQGGSNSFPTRAIFEWHRSYVRYYYKNFANDYSSIFNIFYFCVMICKLIVAETTYMIKQ